MLGWLLRGDRVDYLERSLEDERIAADRLRGKVRDQMHRADVAERDLSQARHDLTVARDDVQALDARAREDARRIAVAAELLDDEREACEELRAQNVALKAELESLRAAIGNARNQLDGRKHYAEPACVGA